MALMTNIIDSEPSNFEEVSMMEVYSFIMKNDVWETVSRPIEKSVVTSRWLLKIKHATNGSVENFKAIFVARGLSQREGINYG